MEVCGCLVGGWLSIQCRLHVYGSEVKYCLYETSGEARGYTNCFISCSSAAMLG